MKLNVLLEYLLRESESETEAPKGSPLGQYLFAQDRKDVPYEQNETGPTEENPKAIDENELEAQLFNHYKGAGDAGSVEKGLKTLKKLEQKGLYTKLLRPPAGLAYRFIGNVTPEQASRDFLHLSVEDITSEPNKAFYVSEIGTVKRPSAVSTVERGKTSISSWTVDPSATQFDEFLGTEDRKVAILLVADIASNNFLLNPQNISNSQADLDGENGSIIGSEQEVLAIGPVNVLEASAIYKLVEAHPAKERMDLIHDIPYIAIRPDPMTKLTPAINFIPILKYVDDAIFVYENELSPQDVAKIKNKVAYKLLTHLATNGFLLSNPKTVNIVINYVNTFWGKNSFTVEKIQTVDGTNTAIVFVTKAANTVIEDIFDTLNDKAGVGKELYSQMLHRLLLGALNLNARLPAR
jgi:hypothetical protein